MPCPGCTPASARDSRTGEQRQRSPRIRPSSVGTPPVTTSAPLASEFASRCLALVRAELRPTDSVDQPAPPRFPWRQPCRRTRDTTSGVGLERSDSASACAGADGVAFDGAWVRLSSATLCQQGAATMAGGAVDAVVHEVLYVLTIAGVLIVQSLTHKAEHKVCQSRRPMLLLRQPECCGQHGRSLIRRLYKACNFVPLSAL